MVVELATKAQYIRIGKRQFRRTPRGTLRKSHSPDAMAQAWRIATMAKILTRQILSLVIRPALSKINLWLPSAEELVLETTIDSILGG
ncbi:hypothetical protein OAJ77_08565 [Rhodospirillales bacterium]|nr:hypothetical protein [Rhodospirillales bacterium]